MTEHGVLASLLATARRRCIRHLVLDNLALALAVAMGGSVLLLLTGTQILNWYWIAILAIAALGAGLYRTRGNIPSEYKVAQQIDHRLRLSDTLSTAAYFMTSRTARADAEVREFQRQAAEEAARKVDTRVAIPFTRPRFAIPAAGLALVALGMFALRFAVTGSMNLEPSLVKVAFDTFFGTSKQQVAKNRTGTSPKDSRPPIEPGSTDAPPNSNDIPPDSVLDTIDDPDTNPPMGDEAKSKAMGRPQDQNGDQGENGEKSDKGTPGNDASNQDNPPPSDNNKNGKQQNSKQNSKQGGQENASMLDKLRDAMANMLNKMKMPQKDGQQNAQNSQQSGKQDGSNQKGQQQSQNQSQSADKDAQADQQQGDNGDKRQSADAKSGDKSADKSSPQDAKSGIGSEDGDKSAKEAEQLQAMGKLSEVLGKRSANVSGEVMVEVGSSKQQLKTPLTQKQAQHRDAGGEIHRDEVPLIFQPFVQQYFEEIRKTPAKEATSTDKTGGKSTKPKSPAPAPAVP